MRSFDVNAAAVASKAEEARTENEAAFKRIAQVVAAARLWALTHEERECQVCGSTGHLAIEAHG